VHRISKIGWTSLAKLTSSSGGTLLAVIAIPALSTLLMLGAELSFPTPLEHSLIMGAAKAIPSAASLQ